MSKISEHFSEKEFRCPCGMCDGGKISLDLIDRLEMFRKLIGDRKIGISSGYRCPAHNMAVKGSPNSQHLLGKAVDVYSIDGDWDSQSKKAMIAGELAGFHGIGQGAGILHLDIRDGEITYWRYD